MSNVEGRIPGDVDVSGYFPWRKFFNYQCNGDFRIGVAIGQRRGGKTYGIRRQVFWDNIHNPGRVFCQIVRNTKKLKGRDHIFDGYYLKHKANGEFTAYATRRAGNKILVAPVANPEVELTAKIIKKMDWRLLGYSVALANAISDKDNTYTRPYRIIFDEAAIDVNKATQFERYMANEAQVFGQAVTTIVAESISEAADTRIYLLMNSCDFSNPYFDFYGINRRFDYGFHKFALGSKKNGLLLYYQPPIANDSRRENSLMFEVTGGDKMVFDNEFSISGDGFVERKSRRAVHILTLICDGKRLGYWADYGRGMHYFTDWAPNNNNPLIALSHDDHTVNTYLVGVNKDLVKRMIKLFSAGMIRFDSIAAAVRFKQVLDLYGVK